MKSPTAAVSSEQHARQFRPNSLSTDTVTPPCAKTQSSRHIQQTTSPKKWIENLRHAYETPGRRVVQMMAFNMLQRLHPVSRQLWRSSGRVTFSQLHIFGIGSRIPIRGPNYGKIPWENRYNQLTGRAVIGAVIGAVNPPALLDVNLLRIIQSWPALSQTSRQQIMPVLDN